MIVNNAYYELFASYTVPNHNQVGYWIDLGANSKGKIVKVYNENIRQWVKVLDASSEDAVAPFIGSNGNWWVDNRDTGVPASGKNPYIGENGYWFVFDALQNKYVDTGVIAKGKSAYDLAVDHGFEGTEEEWLESLKQPALDAAKIALEAAERADEATATLQQIITEVNEAITQTVAATEAANSAAQTANTAAQAANDAADRSNLIANNPPKIVNNFWYMFDEESGEYINTNVHAVGDAFTIVKTYESVEAMQADYSNPEVEIGQFVMIDTGDVNNPEDAQLYLKGDTEWKFIADLSGMQGIQGLSAYQVAVQEGFVGSEEEWVASLKGEKGDKGDQGEQGLQGEPFTYDDFTPDQLEGLKGPKGDTGETGPQGEKGDPFVYEDFTSEQLEALRGPQGIQGEPGPQGIQGEKGDKGDKGDTGSGLTVKGELQSESELPADGVPGDGYFINGYLYVYVGEGGNVESNPKWSNVGNVQGPQGEPGPQGPKGDTGEQGPKGDQGEQGPIGPEGPQGPAGSDAEVTKENVEAVLTGEITTHTHDDRYYTEQEIDEKLSNLPPTYELPIASDSVLGGVKVGEGLAITPEGILSANVTEISWEGITDKPNFATVATSGSYTDLINKPDIYTKTETDEAIKQASATVFKYKGTVANQEALPTEDVSIGDVYTTSDTSSEYVATKASPEPTWEFLGKVVDLSDYSTTEQNDAKYQPIGDYATNTALTEGLATKVNVEEGKGLSTNDFTTELKSKLEGIEAGAQVNTVISVAGRQGDIVLTKEDVGLSNVDNTSDVDKPISTATQDALDLKADATAIVDMLTKTEASTTYATKVEANEISISEGVTPIGEEEIWVDLNAEPNFEAYAIAEAPGDGKIYGRNGQTESWEVSVSESKVNDISNRLSTVEKQEYNATQVTKNGYDGLSNALASVTDEKYKVRGIVLTWYDTTENKWISMRYNGEDSTGWSTIDNWVENSVDVDNLVTKKELGDINTILDNINGEVI